jgi:hypothetical protein
LDSPDNQAKIKDFIRPASWGFHTILKCTVWNCSPMMLDTGFWMLDEKMIHFPSFGIVYGKGGLGVSYP